MMAGSRIDTSALRKVKRAAGIGARAGAEYMLEESNRTIPLDEGTMERSGQVTDDDNGTAVWSWDTLYVLRQHEDTRLRHPNGRRAKWAERTVREKSGQVGEVVAREMRRQL